MKAVSIYLADLRHDYDSVLTSDAMPLGIGYMKAVIDQQIPGINCKIFAYPEKLSAALRDSAPDILMVTNYMWNEALSYHYCELAKKLNPNILVVMGGPNIPIEDDRKIKYLKERNCVDIYVTGEGDFLAAEIATLFIKHNFNINHTLSQHIDSAIYRFSGNPEEIICTPIQPRSRNLDEIPSPWLTGIMDEFFDGKLAPMIETNRGCPFTCTFCVQGTKWYTKVSYFDIHRLKEEIYYVAKKINEKCPGQKVLRVADPNFGMYERDIEISSFFGETQALYEYPLVIDATTGKNRADRIIQAVEKVNGALIVYQAVQSLDSAVLENIKRSNISLETYNTLQVHIQGRGMRSNSDLILGLPGESLKSHLTSLQKMVDAGTNKITCFQAMLLKGSEMEMESERTKYALKSKFRLLPKNFGIYDNEKIFDVDEIVVESNDMSFDDYIKARIYHLVIAIYINSQRFNTLISTINKFNISIWSWIECLTTSIQHEDTPLKELRDNFLRETREELFNSPEELKTYYENDENFEKLVRGELGDNIIYKHIGLSSLYYWDKVVESAIESTKVLTTNILEQHDEKFWEELKMYYRTSFIWGDTEKKLFKEDKLSLQYNIPGWLTSDNLDPRLFYQPHRMELLFSPGKLHKKYLEDTIKILPYNSRSLSMFIRRINLIWLEKSIMIIDNRN